MSNNTNPRDEAELDEFLARESILSTAYDAIDPTEPPEVLDGKILQLAQAAGKAPAAPATTTPAPGERAGPPPAKPVAAMPAAPATARAPSSGRAPLAVDLDDDDDDDADEDTAAAVRRRPRWLVPAALAASLLVAVGVGLSILPAGSPGNLADTNASRLGSLFAKRAKERSEADKAAAEATAASQEAEVVEFAPLPPPPMFEPEGPQIADLDKAISLIRKELVMANQMAAMREEAAAADQKLALTARKAAPAEAGRSSAQTAAPAAAPPDGATADAAGIVQPRDRRLAKILELYDGGNPDLAAASLEIFLRDFEGDPISQRILDAQPKVTDVAVE